MMMMAAQKSPGLYEHTAPFHTHNGESWATNENSINKAAHRSNNTKKQSKHNSKLTMLELFGLFNNRNYDIYCVCICISIYKVYSVCIKEVRNVCIKKIKKEKKVKMTFNLIILGSRFEC